MIEQMVIERKPTRIVLVRHGEAEQNVTNAAGSSVDTPLTSKGHEQAVRRGTQLKEAGYVFSGAYSSHLRRANQTVKEILGAAGQQDLSVVSVDGLEERYMGEVAEQGYLPRGEFDEYILRRVNRDRINLMNEDQLQTYHLIEGMESDSDVITRERNAIRRIVQQHQGETVLVGGHSNSIRTFVVATGYARRENVPSGSLDNTGYVVLETFDGGETFNVIETEGLKISPPNLNNDQAANYMGFTIRRTR